MARYWGNVTLVDRSVATILKAIDESGKTDDTIVVFTSDHGEMMGDHGILGKTLMYETSVRLPLLIRAPMLGRQRRRISGNFSHIDLVPTLMELLGQAGVDGMQGRSRVSVLRGDETLDDNDVFIEWNGADGHPPRSIGEAEPNMSMAHPLRTVITSERWKLNLYGKGQGDLYDLNTDPHELENLYHRPQHGARVRQLTGKIRAWQEESGDKTTLPADL